MKKVNPYNILHFCFPATAKARVYREWNSSIRADREYCIGKLFVGEGLNRNNSFGKASVNPSKDYYLEIHEMYKYVVEL